MEVLITGIKYGLFLTILVGPLVFAFVQAGVERGFRAGGMIGLGVWFSDVIYILITYYSLSKITAFSEWPHFEFTVGLTGGIILIITGILTLINPPPDINKSEKISGPYLALWTKGFLINTINPFTVFFWIYVMTKEVSVKKFSGQEAFLLFTGIIGTIMITDMLKVLLAKRIRHYLEVHHLIWVRRVTGIALILFGIALILRVSV